MSRPMLSVVMPVYNAARFLRQAMDSVLDQDFTDLELIVLNDGSTDETDEIIREYTDPRVRYIRNEGNQGLVYTLNKGVDLAEGEWVARMDGDDLCVQGRFRAQLAYLQAHPEADLLATKVTLIDVDDNVIGDWKDDQRTSSPEEIKRYLSRNNCIAHPTIMARTSLFRHFRYRASQSQSEDYDLWLRMAAAKKQLHKLETPYVLHRLVPSSFTRKRQQNVFRKLAETKWRFLKESKGLGYDPEFLRATCFHACFDQVKAWLKPLKP